MRLVTTASPSAPATDQPLASRTAPGLWRYVLDLGATTPAYLEEQADGWREVSWTDAAQRWTRSRTDCWRAGSAAATPSQSSRGRGSNGCSSTGP